MSRIAVIGAGGYVGPFVCRALQERGHQITAIGRVHARIALAPIGVPVRAAIGEGADFDTVINLAYPTSGSAASAPRQNRSLLAQMRAVGDRGGRVIHVSTLAVFGYTLEHEPLLAPIPPRRDFHYIESKVDLEHRVWKAFRARDCHVVRLGNVWGPASPNWTASLVTALLFGLPVGVAGHDGFSNVTDVANVAALLAALVEAPAGTQLRYHHLAEFSAEKWSHWTGLLAEAIGVEPVLAGERPGLPAALWPEVKAALAPGHPLAVYRRSVWGRYTGSWARSLVRLVPERLFQVLKRRAAGPPVPPQSDGADAVLLELFACPREFRSQVGLAWSPPVSVVESGRRVRAWLAEAGFEVVHR